LTWAAVLLVLFLIVIVCWRARYTRRVTINELTRYIDEFGQYSAEGGVLEIRHEQSPKTMQFALSSDSVASRTIEFGLPEVSWSNEFFDRVTKDAESKGLRCIIEESPGGSKVRRFLSIIIGGDEAEISEGVRELLQICTEAMSFERSDTFKIRFRGVINKSAMAKAKGSPSDSG